jgi:hypothetical protein
LKLISDSRQAFSKGKRLKLLFKRIFTTVSICGANFLIVVSTPALSVIWLTLQLVHAPSSRTLTCLPSSMETSKMCRQSSKGLISSSAFQLQSLILL